MPAAHANDADAGRLERRLLEHQPDHAQRRAPQRERVLRARGLLVDGEEADEGVELVGQGDGDGQGRGRDRVRRALRLVVVADGVGDGVGLAEGAGVVAAHDALKLRELADHARGEVGLGEAGGAFGRRPGSAPTSGAISRARAAMRSTRSAMVPSLAWKVTPLSFSSQASKPTLRSSSQKKRASFRRADRTRLLPAARRRRRRRPRRWRRRGSCGRQPRRVCRESRTAKYFWCVRIEVRTTSGGRSRNGGSMSPRIGVGHSARPATSSSRPSSSTSSSPRAWQAARAASRIFSLRSAASSRTNCCSQLRRDSRRSP